MESRTSRRYWFHGTTTNHSASLKSIDLSKGREGTDFSQGFYVTSDPVQAFEWARGKATKQNLWAKSKEDKVSPIVIVYEVDFAELSNSLDGKSFKSPDAIWGGFVYNNREKVKESMHHSQTGYKTCTDHNLEFKYHFVYGPVADGNAVYDVYTQLKRKNITFDRFLAAIKPKGTMTDQLSFHTKASLQYIHYVGEVSNLAEIKGRYDN